MESSIFKEGKNKKIFPKRKVSIKYEMFSENINPIFMPILHTTFTGPDVSMKAELDKSDNSKIQHIFLLAPDFKSW